MKHVIYALLLLTSLVFAAKTPTVFGPGIEGFLKTKSPEAAFNTVTNDGVVFVSFTGLDAKSQLQLTKCEGNIMVNNIKQIKQKGNITGYADHVVVGLDLMFGTPTTIIKLKGISIKRIWDQNLKIIQCDNLVSLYAPPANGMKGVTIKAKGNIGGPSGLERGEMVALIKSISAKGSIDHLDLTHAKALKAGKTKIKAPFVSDILFTDDQFIIKSKN